MPQILQFLNKEACGANEKMKKIMSTGKASQNKTYGVNMRNEIPRRCVMVAAKSEIRAKRPNIFRF